MSLLPSAGRDVCVLASDYSSVSAKGQISRFERDVRRKCLNLSSSLTPLSSMLRFLSSAMWGLLVVAFVGSERNLKLMKYNYVQI